MDLRGGGACLFLLSHFLVLLFNDGHTADKITHAPAHTHMDTHTHIHFCEPSSWHFTT